MTLTFRLNYDSANPLDFMMKVADLFPLLAGQKVIASGFPNADRMSDVAETLRFEADIEYPGCRHHFYEDSRNRRVVISGGRK